MDNFESVFIEMAQEGKGADDCLRTKLKQIVCNVGHYHFLLVETKHKNGQLLGYKQQTGSIKLHHPSKRKMMTQWRGGQSKFIVHCEFQMNAFRWFWAVCRQISQIIA